MAPNVSKRRNLRDRIKLFTDLRDVLDAMRTFAIVEIGKLTRTQRQRHHLLEELRAAANRTEAYQPAAPEHATRHLYVVLGSERGFCGDFNERIAAEWRSIHAADPAADCIVVGTALGTKLAETSPRAVLSGALGTEDLDAVLLDVVRHIHDWQRSQPAAVAIGVVAYGDDDVESEPILPFSWPRSASRFPATLNLPPATFIRSFTDYYVEAKLHDAFATSLLSESRARAQHMTAALGKLDDDLINLERRSRRLRQEEITQEVETILLAADASPRPTAQP